MKHVKSSRRRSAAALLASASVAAALLASAAPLAVVSPRDGAVVPTLSDGQKAFLSMPRKERVAYFASKECRRKMVGLGWYPKPVRLEWSGGAPGATYRVAVRRMPDGKVFHECEGTNTWTVVDNLEIAREYEWTVSGGGELKARFTTEDMAPRLIRIPGVPNMRDLGGRIGLDGRRVRQGMVFRSTGLNDNAHGEYLSRSSLERAGKITPRMLEEERRIKEHIARYRRYQADPKTFNRSHRGWKAWSRRHPTATVSDYFKRRIHGDEEDLKKLFRVEKTRRPGKSRLTDATRAYLVDVLGIRSEIDLRSDRECYGMKGSPMGTAVKWFHYPSGAYAGMQRSSSKSAFKKVFAVFLDERNYPIDFHCISGQDRTGSVAFILNGLLGVSEEDLYLDWETTGFWNKSTGFRHSLRFDGLVDGFMRHVPGANLHEKIENYVLGLGFTKADIEKFREIMLERK